MRRLRRDLVMGGGLQNRRGERFRKKEKEKTVKVAESRSLFCSLFLGFYFLQSDFVCRGT